VAGQENSNQQQREPLHASVCCIRIAQSLPANLYFNEGVGDDESPL